MTNFFVIFTVGQSDVWRAGTGRFFSFSSFICITALGLNITSCFFQSWRENFEFFDTTPFAAASIGQVHMARLLDGTEVTPLHCRIRGRSQKQYFGSVLWIRIGFSADPDPAFNLNADRDPTRIQEAKTMRIRILIKLLKNKKVEFLHENYT
jgi:hypothetical protein